MLEGGGVLETDAGGVGGGGRAGSRGSGSNVGGVWVAVGSMVVVGEGLMIIRGDTRGDICVQRW